MMHMPPHTVFFHRNAGLTSWCTLMAYVVLTCNDEEFLGTDPDPDPGYIRGGPSHGYNKSPSQSDQYFFSYARGHTNKHRKEQ